MSNVTNLVYVTSEGLEAPVDRLDPDSPFFTKGTKSKLGLRAANSRICGLKWKSGEIRHELSFDDDIIAVQDPVSDFIVVKTSSMGAEEPNNALVFNPDGSLNHQVIAPLLVEEVEQLPGEPPVVYKSPVERILEVLIQNGRVLIGLRFRYEWVERRYYDPGTRRWRERDQIYRH